MGGSRPFKIPLSWREGFRSNARNGSKARLGPRPVIGRYSSPAAAAMGGCSSGFKSGATQPRRASTENRRARPVGQRPGLVAHRRGQKPGDRVAVAGPRRQGGGEGAGGGQRGRGGGVGGGGDVLVRVGHGTVLADEGERS